MPAPAATHTLATFSPAPTSNSLTTSDKSAREQHPMIYTGEFELLVLLAVLRLGDDAYGVTVLEELKRETSRILTLGTVYKTLGRLEQKGHLRARIGPPTRQRGGRRKKLYDVTPIGLEAARRSLSDLRQLAEGLRPEMKIP
jgi:PadR family transcriptional regulator PadR